MVSSPHSKLFLLLEVGEQQNSLFIFFYTIGEQTIFEKSLTSVSKKIDLIIQQTHYCAVPRLARGLKQNNGITSEI